MPEYVTNGTEEITGQTELNGGAIIAAGEVLTNNGTYAGTPVVTSITAGTGISVINPSTPGAATVTNAGVTSITAGTGIEVVNPTGAAIITAVGTPILQLADYAETSFNFALAMNYNIQAINLI